MREHYDVIIIGAGPAGIFAALELAEQSDLGVLLVEKGPDIGERRCWVKELGTCRNCVPCTLLCGWGGAGAFSDGKLTLTTDFGGWLDEYLGRSRVQELIEEVDSIYCRFGAPDTVYGTDEAQVRELQRQAARADLSLIPARIRHLGTERCAQILRAMHSHLDSRVDISTGTTVQEIEVREGRAQGVRLNGDRWVGANHIIAGPGREGSEWFSNQARLLGLQTIMNPVDIGVRVELPAVVMEHITDVVYESKFVFYSQYFDDRVRTFCMNPYGEVVMENNDGIYTVNGHSWGDRRTGNTNFALLVSKTFTEPFKEPIAYGKYIARLANLLSGGVIVQRLADLLDGRRSTPERIQRGMVEPTLPEATPGDLSLVLPYRHLYSLLEMLQALDVVAPGANSRHILLYGIEAKFYSSRYVLNSRLETEVSNLYAIGDGAGVTRGLAQASASGLVAARAILAGQD